MPINKPKVRDYLYLIKNIITESIGKDRLLPPVILFTLVFNFLAAYYTVLATLQLTTISKHFSEPTFNDHLTHFIYLSMMAAVLDFLPSASFTYYLQNIWRRRFAISVNEILNLDHQTFYSKNPGELQYAIFLRSYAAPFCFNLVIDRLSSLAANVLFGFSQIHDKISLNIALVFMLAPTLYFVGIAFYLKYKINYHFSLLTEQEKTSKSLSDKLLNFELIKSYNVEEMQLEHFNTILNSQAKAGRNMGKYEAFMKWILSFILNIPFILILALMALILKSDVTAILSFALLYSTQNIKVKSLSLNIDTLIEFLNQLYFIGISQGDDDGNIDKKDVFFNRRLRIENWSVFYGNKQILTDVNLEIYKKNKIAIVGSNGTGKSTFIKSLLGFAKYKGNIYLDDDKINKSTMDSYLDIISYIPQDDCTSDDSVINNILLGINERIENKTVGQKIALEKKVRELAKKFHIDSTFMEKSEGYHTQAGPQGKNLSAGEKQKIALLRACLKDAPIFIFDEATSSIDKSFELKFVKNILENLKDKTILMIVHGKGLLKLFDKLVFINNGKFEAIGDYENLVKTNENFRNLYS